jgi:hypothetical protein
MLQNKLTPENCFPSLQNSFSTGNNSEADVGFFLSPFLFSTGRERKQTWTFLYFKIFKMRSICLINSPRVSPEGRDMQDELIRQVYLPLLNNSRSLKLGLFLWTICRFLSSSVYFFLDILSSAFYFLSLKVVKFEIFSSYQNIFFYFQ